MATATLSRLDVVPLSQHIGAEIRGIDLRDQLDAETAGAIHQAWLDHCVLLFRGQSFSQEDLIRVTGYFGEIAPLSRPPKFFPKGYSRLLPNIMMISNIRENGETIGALPDGEMHFHHDQIHSEIPHNGTLLYSLEIPSHGGDTLFASGYAAYDTLDPALKARLEGRRAFHHYNYGTTIRGGTMGIEAFAESSHPVFRTHDESGRKAIYVNRLMTMRIDGLPPEESDGLLAALFDHSEKRCSMHARDDFPSDQRRLMFRTTVKGSTAPY
jgi:taurine dioxygenase